MWDLWRRLVPGAFVALQRGLGQGDPPATGKPRPSLQSILYSSMIWYFKWKFVKMWYKQSLDRSSSRVTLWQLASHRLWSTYTVNSTTSDQPTSGNIIQMPFSTIARLVILWKPSRRFCLYFEESGQGDNKITNGNGVNIFSNALCLDKWL